ncbi:MAG: cytochrome c [Myxococcota bacterium]
MRAEIPVREAFQLHCSGCHGSDGRGRAGFVPDLRALAPLVATQGGREYLVRVPGVAQAPVGSASLARLLNYVLAELAGVEEFEAFRAEEVERLRRAPLLDPVGARPIPRRP